MSAAGVGGAGAGGGYAGKFVVICGATASGKSALAVELALWLQRERGLRCKVLAADAFQVYRGMDIGTAKPTVAERAGVEHGLIDLVEPSEAFTLEDWLTRAAAEIQACRGAGVVPIVVGGTHLYIKALLEGMFAGPGSDAGIRARLGALDRRELRAMLEKADPAAALRLHGNDTRRTIRALEVYELTGRPMSEHQKQWGSGGGVRPDALLVALHWPVEELNRRINQRVRAMRSAGLVDEVRGLVERGVLGVQSGEALGYKQLVPIVSTALARGVWPPGQGEVDEAFERIKVQTRRFGKSQRTWLRQLGALAGCVNVQMGAGVDVGAIAGMALGVLRPDRC